MLPEGFPFHQFIIIFLCVCPTLQGAKRISLSYNPNKPQTVKGILSHLDMERIEKGPKEVFNPEIQKEILVLEEQEVRLVLGDKFNRNVFQILPIYNYIVI